MILDPVSSYVLVTSAHRSRIETAALHRIATGDTADRIRYRRTIFRPALSRVRH